MRQPYTNLGPRRGIPNARVVQVTREEKEDRSPPYVRPRVTEVSREAL